jgi:hypothetical protein
VCVCVCKYIVRSSPLQSRKSVGARKRTSELERKREGGREGGGGVCVGGGGGETEREPEREGEREDDNFFKKKFYFIMKFIIIILEINTYIFNMKIYFHFFYFTK